MRHPSPNRWRRPRPETPRIPPPSPSIANPVTCAPIPHRMCFGMILRAEIYPENFLLILLAAAAATMLAGVYPAWRAGRVDPVDSIRLV